MKKEYRKLNQKTPKPHKPISICQNKEKTLAWNIIELFNILKLMVIFGNTKSFTIQIYRLQIKFDDKFDAAIKKHQQSYYVHTVVWS